MRAVLSKIQPETKKHMYSASFRRVLDDHVPLMQISGNTEDVPVTGQLNLMHRGNFYGLLRDLKIDQGYHWITLRVNGLSNQQDYTGNLSSLKVPSKDYINMLLSRHVNSLTTK